MTVEKVIFSMTGVRYDPYLKHLSFDQIISLLTPKIIGIARKNQASIPGYTIDDIQQELLIEVWQKFPKIPREIDKADRRFFSYFETIFSRKIIDLHRSLLVARRKGEYRDAIHRSTFVEDVTLVIERVLYSED